MRNGRIPLQVVRNAARCVPWLTAAAVLFAAGPAQAESVIKNPGRHPDYSVELEPHLLFAWEHDVWGTAGDTGYGLGFRASIPIIQNGPIKKINNSMAIGFGLDWAHYSDQCWWGGRDARWALYYDRDCTANTFWIPVVLQWNFWLTDIISVFGEPGLAIEHSSWNYWWLGPCAGGVCEYDDSDTDLEPIILFGGARFMFGESVGLTVRLGWPYVSVGASFLL